MVIIGAGIAGLCAGIRLREAGLGNLIILEKADRIGGTWRDNSYPGAACDVPSHLYSYSFALKGDWSERYAGQPEILSYLEDCAETFSLMECIRFNAEVAGADYAEPDRFWRIRLTDGETIEADILITACGQLHRPLLPDIPGRDSFAGPGFHSARWRHDIDLANSAVAIVGNGASAVQIAPAIAPVVSRLTVFQRTANWIVPRRNPPYSPSAKALLTRRPLIRQFLRAAQYWKHEVTLAVFRSGSIASRAATAAIQAKMNRKIKDERLREALIPTYPLGCKRILRTGAYLPMFQDDGVSLETAPIERITPDGIVTSDGREHPADVIVYATGFTATDFLAPMEIHGRGGTSLNEAWRTGASAYLGMAVPGFPNVFMLYGPGTNLGHNSVIFMIERQVAYVTRLLLSMRSAGHREAEVRSEILEGFSRRLQRRMARMAWSGECPSFYKDRDGRVVGLWPYSTVRYWRETRRPRLSDYDFD